MADRLTQTGQFVGGLFANQAENEADRAAQLEQISARGEEDRQTTQSRYEPFPDGPRTITDAATGRTVTVSTPAEYDAVASQLQGFRQETGIQAERDMAKLDWQKRFEAMAQEQRNALEMMERELNLTREVYEDGSYQTQDGATFTWDTPEGYQAALAEIQEHTRKLSGLARDNPTAWEVYQEATERAKQQMWEPSYDENGMVQWERTDVSAEKLLENFVAELPMTEMTPEQTENAIEAFRTYLVNAEDAPPQEFSQAAGGDTTTVTVEGQRDSIYTPAVAEVARSGAGGALAAPALDAAKYLFGWIPGLNQTIDAASARLLDEVPSGVSRPEYEVWNRLRGLTQNYDLSEEDANLALSYGSALMAEGTSEREVRNRIDDFIERALGRSSRRGTGTNPFGGM